MSDHGLEQAQEGSGLDLLDYRQKKAVLCCGLRHVPLIIRVSASSKLKNGQEHTDMRYEKEGKDHCQR